MTLPATIEEYFQQPDAERILLVEITRRDPGETTYYLSDAPYITEPDDTPPDLNYSAVISGSGLPEMRRTMPDPFEGESSTSAGTLTLADEALVYTSSRAPDYLLIDDDPPARLLTDPDDGSRLLIEPAPTGINPNPGLKRGAAVLAKIAAPRRLYPYADAVTLFRGQIARVGGDSDGNITLEITDGTDVVRRAIVPVTNNPLCFGYARNIQPFLVDSGNLVYSVHDGPIEAVEAVYDQGILLAPANYTVNVTTGRVTLHNQPAGIVTVDAKGAKVDGVWLQTTEQIARALIDRAGLALPQSYTGLSTGLIGLFLTESTELGGLLTRLMRGAAAYWIVDRTGDFRAAPTQVPGAGGTVFDETTLLDSVQYIEDDRLHSAVRYLYRPNWTQYQSRPGAAQAQADFSPREGLEGSVSITPDDELIYLDSERLETFFDDQVDAETAAQVLLDIFSVQRQRLTTAVPFSETLSLGDDLTLRFLGREYRGIVSSVADVFDGEYPIQRIEVIA